MKNTSNIPADLNLAQSLQRFETLVRTILTLDELGSWNGSRLREIESEIRQGALALAGQCIALLVSKLSSSTEANAISQAQTQGLRRPGSKGHGFRNLSLTTVGNVTFRLRLPYVVQGSSTGIQGQLSHQWISGGFYPFLQWLGLSERVTPLVWATIAEYGTVSASFAIAQRLLHHWGMTISERRVRRLTYRFGQIGLELRAQQLAQQQAGTLATTSTLTGHRVVISVDGGRTRLRRNKRGRRRAKTGRHGFHGDWREPLLLTIYAVDEQGHKLNTQKMPITNDGTFAHHQALLKLLEMNLVRLGIQSCQCVLLIADGARWIWNKIPPLLEQLGVPEARQYQLFDFYHALEHLQDFAQLACSTPSSLKAWVKKSRTLLKRGHINQLIKTMKQLADNAKGQKREDLIQALEYFSRQPQRFGYSHIAALNLPIGSGSIESLIRQVVNLRLKGNGKFWLPQQAEIILHGRCQWAAGSWANFANSILTAGLA